LKREIEEVVDVVIPNIIYGVGIALMFGSVLVFGYGHFTQNAEWMSRASHWGLAGAVMTIVFGIIRRARSHASAKGKLEETRGDQ